MGLYVPPIPEKKAMGNTENEFVAERRFFLDKFMKDIAGLPYLYESQEFATFLRPAGDVDACFAQLPHLSTDQMLSRFREVIPVNEHGTDEYKIKRYNDEVINGFMKDCNVLMQALEAFKNQMRVIVPMKDQEVMYYKNFVDFLVKYEQVNEKQLAKIPGRQADPNVSTTLLYGAWGDELKQKLSQTAQNIKNPFKHMRNWVKSELMELKSLVEAISRKEGVDAARNKAMSKIRDKKETIDKMN
jgi:sorting nexin-1/2